MPNIAMGSGYSSIFGYTGNTLTRYNNFINHLQNLDPKEPRAESRFVRLTPQFSMLGFDAIAFHPKDLPSRAKPIGRLGDRVLTPFYESSSEQRRAFLAATPKYFSHQDNALLYVLSTHTDPFSRPAIERDTEQLSAHPLEKDESVRFVSFEPNRVELEVNTKWPRELVLCSMFEKNWKAEVNGVFTRIEPANYVFRAVQVPEGTSRVIFHYRPTAFYLGAGVTGLSIVILLAILAGGKTGLSRLMAARRSKTGTC
jgi:hypothetical protein